MGTNDGKFKGSYSLDQACELDQAGREYGVLFGEPTAPEGVLRIAEHRVWLQVLWLDHLLRRRLSYLFIAGSDYGRDDTLRFLEQVGTRGYDHDTPPPDGRHSAIQTEYFKPDGSIYSQRGVRATGTLDVSRSTLPPELIETTLWEPDPAFGDWASLTRLER